MDTHSRIYIAGHTGLVGSAIMRRLMAEGYTNLIVRSHTELDLTCQTEVVKFFKSEKPEFVFLAAAKVGGILANSSYPADFIYDNLSIQNHVIHAARKNDVKRLLFLGSSCIYPRDCPQPMKEEYLLTGPLEETNEPYAIAKIAGIKLCQSYNRQYGTRFIAVMPTNLYGPNDNFDLENSHVLPALIRKFHLAKLASTGDWQAIKKDEKKYGVIPDDFLTSLYAISKRAGYVDDIPEHLPRTDAAVLLWGTGSPRREFLYVCDLADACVAVINFDQQTYDSLVFDSDAPLLNIGCGKDNSIKELSDIVSKNVGFDGRVIFDPSKPDGTPQKLLDIAKLSKLGWSPQTSLDEGIQKTYQWYLTD